MCPAIAYLHVTFQSEHVTVQFHQTPPMIVASAVQGGLDRIVLYHSEKIGAVQKTLLAKVLEQLITQHLMA